MTREGLKKRRIVVPAKAGTYVLQRENRPPPPRGNVTPERSCRGRLFQTFPRGFTLIEVVVAFAIAALCLGAASQVFSAAARHVGLVQERMRALSGAESIMAAAGVSEALAPGVLSGALTGGLRWRRTVEPYSGEEAVAGATPVWVAYRVTVQVDHDARPVVSISSVRLGKAP